MRFKGFSQQFYRFIADKRRPDGHPYLLSTPKTDDDLHAAAYAYMQDMIEHPECYVACPGEYDLDVGEILKTDDGRDISALDDEALLQAFLEHDDSKLHVWLHWYNGTLLDYQRTAAKQVSKYRCEALKTNALHVLSLLSCNAIVAAQLMHFISRYCVKIDAQGKLHFLKIKKNNKHHLMSLTDKLLICMLQCLPNAKSVKQCCIQGIRHYHHAGKVAKNGWVEFEQSSSMDDAENLKNQCIGTDWCISSCLATAKSYLSEGSFYIYFDMGTPVVAVHDGDEVVVEGRGHTRLVSELYQHEVSRFLVEKGLCDEQEFYFEGGEFVFLKGSSFDEADQHFNMVERGLIGDTLWSIQQKKLSGALLQKVHVCANKGQVHLDHIGEGNFVLPPSMHAKLASMLSFESQVQAHEDGSLTVYGNVNADDNRSILARIREVKGSLKLFGEQGLSLPCLQRVGGYLDMRNSVDMALPNLRDVKGVMDVSGARGVDCPKLRYVGEELIDGDGGLHAPMLNHGLFLSDTV